MSAAKSAEQSAQEAGAPGVVGGHLVARRLKAHGVTKLFTLSGGHLFSIYDGYRAQGIDIGDVRHEQSAAFAAEGWSKVTRTPGVAALTAGPGITNGMSAIASAQQNHSPLLILGGRAAAHRWGRGSLQELDHVPFVAPLTKLAMTVAGTGAIPAAVDAALAAAIEPHGGPSFVDFPLDHVFSEAPEPRCDSAPRVDPAAGPPADGAQMDLAIAALRAAERPVIMAGSDLYWGASSRRASPHGRRSPSCTGAHGDPRRAARVRGGRGPGPARGSTRCASPNMRRARASRPTWPTDAPRCTRCASTPSSPPCSTATRSSSATAATSSPSRDA